MKKTSLVFGLTFLLSTLSHAGWGWNKDAYRSAKSPLVEQRVTGYSYCYDAGFEFSAFGSGFWPEETTSQNSLGGGVSLAYFFGHNLGIEASYSAHGSAQADQVGTLNMVYRLPLGGECCSTIAPYVFGGGGVVSDGDYQCLWNLGGGLDVRFEGMGCVGFFGDFSYNWVDEGLADFTLIRVGVRLPF